MTSKRWFACLALAAFGLGCGLEGPPPPLPAPELSAYSAAVRDQLQAALTKAAADPESAKTVGDCGRVLYAYGLLDAASQAFERAHALEPADFKWAYFLGVTEADRGRVSEAESALRLATRLKPADLPTAIRLADLLEKAGDERRAIEILEAATAGGTDAAARSFRLGRLYASLDREESAQHLERAIEAEPGYREAHYLLANRYTLAGRDRDAQRHLEIYEKADPTVRRHYADPLLDALVELKAGDAQTLYDDGLARQTAGKLDEALSLYRSVLEIEPDHLPTHVSLIAVFGTMGDIAEASRHFERAIAVNPDLPEAYYNIGLARHQSREFAGAVEAFRKVLEINPADAKTHGNLGVSLDQLGRGAAADKQFREALTHDPSNLTANFHLGRRLAERGQYRRALPFLKKAVEQPRANPAIHTYLFALVLRELGESEEAKRQAAIALTEARAEGQAELAATIETQFKL